MSYFDEYVDDADRTLTEAEIKQALEILNAPTLGETGADGAANANPIDATLSKIDWDEKAVTALVAHIDNPFTSGVGAGAAANADAAIEALEGMSRAAESGWTGSAAEAFNANSAVVQQNLEQFKEELERLAKDTAADAVEQMGSATQEMKELTKNVARKADDIAIQYAKYASIIVDGNVSSTDPTYLSAQNNLENAATDFQNFVNTQINAILSKVVPYIAAHGHPLDMRNPLSATGSQVPAEFNADPQIMALATRYAEQALAKLRDTRKDIEDANVANMFFGISLPADDVSGAWLTAIRCRLDDLAGSKTNTGTPGLIAQVERLIRGLIITKTNYEDVEDDNESDIARILNKRFEHDALSGNPEDTPIEDHDLLAIDEADQEIKEVLDSDWEGVGQLPGESGGGGDGDGGGDDEGEPG